MKLAFILTSLILGSGLTNMSVEPGSKLYLDQTGPKPIDEFLKLKWEVEVTCNNAVPATYDNYLYTCENFAIDALKGDKVSLEMFEKEYSDSILIYSTDLKLKVRNLNNRNYSFEETRKRSYYIGSEQIELTRDSIWVEVVDDKEVRGVNLNEKKIIWKVATNSRIFNKPIVVANEIYLVDQTHLIVFDKLNGELVSKHPLGGTTLSGITYHQGHLYMVVKNVGLIAFNLDDKKISWVFEMSTYSSKINRVVVEKDKIYVTDNSLYAINRFDGKLIWKIGEEEGIYIYRTELNKVKDYLIFYSLEDNDPILTVANKANGEILYQGFNSNIVGGNKDNPDNVASEDLFMIMFKEDLIDNKILVGVMDGKIYGFELLK
ncbi:hypothetical protein C900_02316 [Fulvivirga imtechensis AK7]|uniref:Pyrrolo-quinoline quinone repeat domain-containing protein n=1 Tax=Fulvivirga imtechensis AK7 TaxID=1237149 RepID=L8JRZ6_9BACT|nr:PQQ-binding-like beta-propeller repeat protein [Fulvivirga imtechensis]ELR71731.1 hypothetical protein C900_02316 [Fulvivirga imtechensis AK7]